MFLMGQSTWGPYSETVKIMPLGDSITAGGSSGTPFDPEYYVAYRLALWNKLAADGYDIDFVGGQNSGSAVLADSDHEGHGGWRDDEILNGCSWDPDKGKLVDWLTAYQPDIVLLHIGTNGLGPSPDDVEGILAEIDNYSADAWVVLALIVNQSCSVNDPPCAASSTVTLFNDNVAAMAQDRIDRLGDKIVLVDMENGAGLDYHLTAHNPPGNMWDNLHPYESGYEKMADVWFSALEKIFSEEVTR